MRSWYYNTFGDLNTITTKKKNLKNPTLVTANYG